MATESPIRILEANGKWASRREAATFGPSSANMSSEDLQLVLRSQRFEGSGRGVVPNRSESAPPSIEGSLAAIEKLVSEQDPCVSADLGSINSAMDNCESEEQFRADPAYLAYYCANVNLNPKLPPHLISWEKPHLVRFGGSNNNSWRLTSSNDCSNGSLHLSQSNLPTHEEESEDDRSPQRVPDDWTDVSSGFWSGHDTTSSGQHKSLADLIKEELPPGSSPVVHQSCSLSHELLEEVSDCKADSSSLHDPSVSMANAITLPPGVEDIGLSSNIVPSVAAVSCSSSVDGRGGATAKPAFLGRKVNIIDVHSEDEPLITGVTDSDVTCVESKMKAINLSRLPHSDTRKYQKNWQNSCQNNMLQQQVHQQKSESQVRVAKSQMISQGVNHTYSGMNQFFHASSNLSAAEAQPVLQSSGFAPPFYATAAAYMASPSPFYPNLHPSSYFSPQYGLGGYSLNTTAIPTYLAGYPHQSPIPLAFDSAAGPSYSSSTSGVLTGGSLAGGVDMQHPNEFYAQFGFAMQTPLADPFHMQYSQQPPENSYNASSQFDPFVSRAGPIVNQVSVPDPQKGSDFTAFWTEQQPQHQGSLGLSNLNLRRGGIPGSNFNGSAMNMGILMQLPTSPMANPVLPGSPVGAPGFPGGKTGVSFPSGTSRNSGMHPGWQGQGGPANFNTRIYSFLEELKSGKGRRYELPDIMGHIVEFSADQHGSRFIQQKLENCSVEEKASVFKEVLPHASKLMTDVFGNYVIQKFFEYGSPEQRKDLANQLEGQILPFSLQMYGCRVIQKALDVIELEQKIKLVRELDGHVLRCVRDQNGNHVIQKCIESISTDKIGFMISAFRGQVATLSTHPYGCRVIQRILEHCTDELQSQFIVDEILESICALAQDQYGNYVTQHVLERGKPHEKRQIISNLSGHIVKLSQHKFASNVVEKCLEHGDSAARDMLIGEIIGQNDGNDNLLIMMKDQYANYVVQKILEMCTENQRELLLGRISVHLNALKKYTYGKHIVARFEQLYGEEIQNSES